MQAAQGSGEPLESGAAIGHTRAGHLDPNCAGRAVHQHSRRDQLAVAGADVQDVCVSGVCRIPEGWIREHVCRQRAVG
eukprot:scaffold32349_cov56-Phaeocystis_antarctica.AAC.2